MFGLNEILTHSLAYAMGEDEGRTKAKKEDNNPWHTGEPIEEGWYLTKVTNVDKPYEVLKFENGKWYDYLDYDDVPEVVNDSYVIEWQKIED